MASISTEPGGRRVIQFQGTDRKRRSIRLGKVARRQAEAVKVRVEQLVSAALTRTAPDPETARWVASLGDDLYAKLAAVGLLTPRVGSALGPFLSAYIGGRHDAKPRTIALMQQAAANLVGYFGEGKPLREVTPGDADDYRLHLLGEGLAENTIRRRLGRAKQFFTAAVRRRLIDANPFADQKCAVGSNVARMRFVTRADAEAVLDACPDHEWRLIFALSRFGGLRCPSEHFALRWQDVDWEREQLTVTSSKTEHHEGKGQRRVPIFPELRSYLADAFDHAEPGAVFVVGRYRNVNRNLRTHMLRIIRRAGVTPWPKVFQNLRSSRETELAESFPMHVVCAWIGNSQSVAAKHYLQVTDEHFRQAVQNPVQQAAAPARTGLRTLNRTQEKTPGLPGVSTPCDGMQYTSAPRVGLEGTGQLVGESCRQHCPASNRLPGIGLRDFQHCPALARVLANVANAGTSAVHRNPQGECGSAAPAHAARRLEARW